MVDFKNLKVYTRDSINETIYSTQYSVGMSSRLSSYLIDADNVTNVIENVLTSHLHAIWDDMYGDLYKNLKRLLSMYHAHMPRELIEKLDAIIDDIDVQKYTVELMAIHEKQKKEK